MTDIEIAQKNVMSPISDVAKKIGLTEDDLEFYGKYKAKITMTVTEVSIGSGLRTFSTEE